MPNQHRNQDFKMSLRGEGYDEHLLKRNKSTMQRATPKPLSLNRTLLLGQYALRYLLRQDLPADIWALCEDEEVKAVTAYKRAK